VEKPVDNYVDKQGKCVADALLDRIAQGLSKNINNKYQVVRNIVFDHRHL
jgi:hypothetical protein